MYDNIAVMLRGHVRNWHVIYPYVFQFYESLAHNVDYYFYTWKSKFSKDVPETFEGKNLVSFYEFEPTIQFTTSWRGPAYLNYMALHYMTPKHNENPYNVIIDTRPDVLTRLRDPVYGLMIHEPKKVYVPYIERHLCQKHNDLSIAVADHFIMFTDLKIIDKLSHRMYAESEYGNQVGLRRLIEENNYGLNTARNVDSRITRPNIVSVIGDINRMLDSNNDLQLEWSMHLTTEEKIKICEENKIDPADYKTYSSLAKIW
jgi:hypothetical protein